MAIKTNDALIDDEIARFEALAINEGLEAAKAEFISRLIAESYWFKKTFGTRQAYQLYQRLTDHVVEHDHAA
jgi:hypothetical protein